jgi:hypothetical protein
MPGGCWPIRCAELTGWRRETQWGCKWPSPLRNLSECCTSGRETQWARKFLALNEMAADMAPSSRETA